METRLMEAVAIFREEWEKRLDDCADIIAELIADALTHTESAPGSELASRQRAVAEKLKAQYMRSVSEREAKAPPRTDSPLRAPSREDCAVDRPCHRCGIV